MTNVLWVLVLCGLWAERVAGGAVLQRFEKRLTPRRKVGSGLVEYREGGGSRDEDRVQRQRLVEFGIQDDKRESRTEDDVLGTYKLERRNGGEASVEERLEDQLPASGDEGKYIGVKETGRTVLNRNEVEKTDISRGKNRNAESNLKMLRQYRQGNFGEIIEDKENLGITDRNNFQINFDTENAFTESGNLLELKAPKHDALPGSAGVLADQSASQCVTTPRDDSTIHAAVILPKSTEYTMALAKVMPVLRLAQEEVRRRQLLPKHLNFHFLPWDDRCDAVYAQIATFEAVKKDVHVFFGPACEYSVAPVARMIKFWGKPLLTTGALTFDFSRDKRTPDSEYHLLLRAGLLSYRDLAFFLIALLDRYGWGKVMLVYDKDGCRHISGKHTCKLMMETLVEFFKRQGLNYGSYDMEKNAADGLLDNLRREMGYQYNSKYIVHCSLLKTVP